MPPSEYNFPTVHDGVRGMRFIYTSVESAKKGGAWVQMDDATSFDVRSVRL